MKSEHINPFLQAIANVLEQFGIQPVTRGAMQLKSGLTIDKDVTTVLGLVGEMQGNVAYSLNKETALKLASTMMMGMPLADLDEMAQSAISEFSNMVTGNAASQLAELGVHLDISPPSLIMGDNIMMSVSSATTVAIKMETPVGEIEVNIAFLV